MRGKAVNRLSMRCMRVRVIASRTSEMMEVSRSNGPSTGCHLHLAISVVGNTNAAIAELPRSESIGGPSGFVDPEQFYEAFGLTLCAPDSCRRTY